MPEAKNRELAILTTAAIFAVFGAIDYLGPGVMRRPHPGSEWLGVCAAQVTLIAAWAVFAPGNIVVRLPWALLLGLAMWYVVVISFQQWAFVGPRMSPKDVLVLGEVLLLSVAVLQIPLWIAKRAFRYRLLMPGEVPTPVAQERLQFQVKHLLIGTFVLAVALSPIRYVLPKERVASLAPSGELLILVPTVIVVNLVATLPCLWVGLASLNFILMLIGWAVYCLVVTGVEFAVLCAFRPAGRYLELFAVLYAMNICQAVVVFAVMRIYRALGFRLQRIPREAPPQLQTPLDWEI